MHCIAALELHGFYMSVLQADMPVDTAAVVLMKDKVVLDASRFACERGVSQGQSGAEARAILGKQASFLDWTEERFQVSAEKWLDIAATFTGYVEPRSQHQALLDLSDHPDPLKAAVELRQTLTHALQVPVAIGVGSCPWIAEASCTTGALSLASLLTPRTFIGPLSTLRLEPVAMKERVKLMALGYRTIGAVATIPTATLRELFGRHAFLIAGAAQGMGNPRINPCYPKASTAEFICFESAPNNWQEIEEVGRHLALRLAVTLSTEDLLAHEMEVIATLEDGDRVEFTRIFTAPVKTATGIEQALSLMLKEPFEKPLERLLVRLKNLEKLRRIQKTLEGFVKGADRSTAVERTVTSLKATFGAQAIERAGALPIARHQAVRRAWQEANGWAWK